ncbi:MAG: PQQ-dependent sugar dehydrogenase [Solirubrobacterales bacterium]
MKRAVVALALLISSSATGVAHAATLQPVGSFQAPIYVTSDPGNPEQLFVVERAGRIDLVQGRATTTFADIRSVVSCCEGERGLLSIALAPDFDTSGRLYVDYTGKEEPGEIHVAEMRASGGSASLASLRNLLTIKHPGEENHYGGQLQFGPEGMLFVSTGDGGGGNDVHHNAQNHETSLLGKLLRIDPDPSGVLPYTAPAGNPFATNPAPYNAIWSYGLRNPFRFSFDSLRGDLWIGDVGQDEREEVDYAPAPGLGGGANYGWNCREGTIPGPETDPQCATTPPASFVDPIFDYTHNPACAIIGGYVVRDQSLGGLYGRYLYGDHCTGEIRSFDLANPFGSDSSEGLTVEELDSFGEDSCGRLYAVSGAGRLFRLTGTSPATCATAPRASSFVGIKAQGRRVRRGGRALITGWVSPCNGRRGEPVKLMRGRRRIATRHLDRACTVHFRPRIRHRSQFRTSVGEDANYIAAVSRRLKIRIDHRKGPRRPRWPAPVGRLP